MRWPRAAILSAVLLGFAALAAARLNPLSLLEPDAADYLFTSRALAILHGYREIDHPGEPLHSFRPPGLPLLLLPLSWLLPYNVVAAKGVVLATGLVVLALIRALGREAGGAAAGATALVLVATSPYTLLHATEIASEAPYLACSLAVVLILARADGVPRWGKVAALAVLLSVLPFLRTIGVTLVAAVGAWGLLRRVRRRWALAALAAAPPALLWSWRDHAAGGPTYLSNVLTGWSGSDPRAFASHAAAEAWSYLGRLGEVLLPGLSPGQPLYERVTLAPAPDLGVPGGLASLLAAAVLVLALAGMLVRREREGEAVLIHALLFVVGLAVYPPKHERLAWPLVPLVWVYAAAGLAALSARSRSRPARASVTAAVVLALGWSAWQGTASAAMARANVRWLVEGDRFYDRVPPMYFCDWQAAGRWISLHTPAHARVLTRHSDLGFTARRFQEGVRFEEMSPGEWRGAIARFGARYLALPTTLFGKLVPKQAMDSDPAYVFTPVYRARDVVVLEVQPNRTGLARAAESPEEDLAACRRALDRWPGRVDLIRRHAELLEEAGHGEDAVATLRRAIDAGRRDAGLHVTLGAILLDLGRAEGARESFRAAKGLPGADDLSTTIERGLLRAGEAVREEREPPAARAARLTEEARRRLGVLDFEGALHLAREALDLVPGEATALSTAGEALERLGREEEAASLLERAARAGDEGAAGRLERLRLAREVEVGAGTAGPDRDVRLAILEARDGLPGEALAVLERAQKRSPGSRDVLAPLAELYLFYGFPEKSEPLYRHLLEADPEDRRARSGLEASLERLRRCRS